MAANTSVDGGPTAATHEEFNASDADISIQSADGIIFRLHLKNLEVNTGAFPGAEFYTPGEIVHLTEAAKVLEIVFPFIYAKRDMPLPKKLDIETLVAVAEAVEKYEVFLAMNVCMGRLREFLPAQGAAVFLHAIKHDYPDLVNETALLLARSSSLDFLRRLPSYCVIPWIEYQTAWNKIFENAIQGLPPLHPSDLCCYIQPLAYQASVSGDHVCDNCRPALINWIIELQNINTISSLNEALKNPLLKVKNTHHRWCGSCSGNTCRSLPDVARALEKGIKAIPLFIHFLKPNQTDSDRTASS